VTTYLLDTSAVIAHYRKEPGYAQVHALFEDPFATVLIGTPVLVELDAALKRGMQDERQRRAVVDAYGGRVAEVVPADREAAMAAIAMRNASAKRLPAMDALIAGCAVAHGAVLVHRDPHFDGIPAEHLQTLRLSETGYPTSQDVAKVAKESGVGYATRSRTTSRRA